MRATKASTSWVKPAAAIVSESMSTVNGPAGVASVVYRRALVRVLVGVLVVAT